MALSENDLGLLCAGYTAILGFQVVPPRSLVQQSAASSIWESAFSWIRPESARSVLPKIGVHELFHTTYQPFVPSLAQPRSWLMLESGSSDDVNVTVKMINGGTTTIRARQGETVESIKAGIQRKLSIPFQGLQLTHFGQKMSDAHTIDMYMPATQLESVGKPSLCCVGGGGPYELDCSEFDPPYNYDFTNVKDDGKEYKRGGKVYHRPYGWKRFAVKVLNDDRYGGDNTWLG
ncbi:uncharacterized protein LOC110240313, partial [Exaiptasia diaphana]